MKILLSLFICMPLTLSAQHTFSIVAIDSITGEIGSAGATCGDSIIWPGTPGAILISDVIPGIGAIHTQSYYTENNQLNAQDRMLAGDSPEEIINWLVANDVASNPGIRQYGIIDFNNGSPRSAAFTGENCFDYKNHILGINYAIQGNILLGQQILDSMETGFNNTDGCLSDKLMAAMQGANVVGADTRCISEGTSSLSAFLRVAKPNDDPNAIFIDLNIAGTPLGVEPLDKLQTKYNNWKNNNNHDCSAQGIIEPVHESEPALIYPNPSGDLIYVQRKGIPMYRIEISDISGKTILNQNIPEPKEIIEIAVGHLKDGEYFITSFAQGAATDTNKFTISSNN